MSGDVFWIKLQTNTFDSETVLLLESMPEGDTLLIIWFKMQILAGKCNAGGYLLLNDDRPYSDEMLATVFRRPLNTVRLAITAFLQFKMVEIIDGAYFLPEWEKYQNVSGLDKIREQTKVRVARHRAKRKNIALPVTLPITQGNSTETEEEEDEEKQQQEIRLLLINTPFSQITSSELNMISDRHGYSRLKLVADVVAESWRRNRKEIETPSGYLNSMCAKSTLPAWYVSPKERNTKRAQADDQKRAAIEAECQKQATEQKMTMAREAFWQSITDSDRERFCTEAADSSPVGLELPSVAIVEIAKINAWQRHSQLSANTNCLQQVY